jgi:hypothetical protein
MYYSTMLTFQPLRGSASGDDADSWLQGREEKALTHVFIAEICSFHTIRSYLIHVFFGI